MSYVMIIFTLLLCLNHESEAKMPRRKLVFQKDISEHCRRRVIPSVFLGRHVVDAYSQILHLSKLDLPYSCFITVRTESGSNIILVVQLKSHDTLVDACRESPNQLLVYEMGETFGGYWGPLAGLHMRTPPSMSTVYTLETTESTQESTTMTETEETVVTTTDPLEKPEDSELDTDSYITMDIPLVNVTGRFIPGGYDPGKSFDIDENFDLIYNVFPRENVSYHTSLLPLVQFSVSMAEGPRSGTDANSEIRYDLAYNLDEITLDSRLKDLPLPISNKGGTYPKFDYGVNKLLKLQKRPPFFKANDKSSFIKRIQSASRYRVKGNTVTRNRLSYSTEAITKPITTRGSNTSEIDSWEYIQELIKEYTDSVNYSTVSEDTNYTKQISVMLDELSNMEHSTNAYLYTKSYLYDLLQSKNKNKYYEKKITPVTNYRNDYNYTFTMALPSTTTSVLSTSDQTEKNIVILKNHSQYNTSIQINKTTTETVTELTRFRNKNIYDNYYLKSDVGLKPESKNESKNPETGSLLNHESWGNVVQVAPVIAVLLNQTNQENNNISSPDRFHNGSVDARMKRHLKPIPISDAQPHTLTTAKIVTTTAPTAYDVYDIQKFFQLIELPDNNLQGRVAMRYLHNYMGQSLFNICEYNEPQTRHVYLFNSSRIVLAITNFTIQKMTVVMTPATTLLSRNVQCGKNNLECQVAGNRVCIDSLSACDGVPNCGAYDIYDEDRLVCDAAMGLQHNVWLAAGTFLALMLTLLYAVHYWLKRCVPKVSNAFFIYTDGDENALNLNTIMRAPHDLNDKASIYGGILEFSYIYSGDENKHSKSFSCNWLTKLCKKFKRKKKIQKKFDEEISDSRLNFRKKISSYKITEVPKTDTCVQTGESLEMPNLKIDKNVKSNSHERQSAKWDEQSIFSDDYLKHSELSLIKMFKNNSVESVSKTGLFNLPLDISSETLNSDVPNEEMELQSHLYRRETTVSSTNLLMGTTQELYTGEVPAPKHLRFDEELVAIDAAYSEQFNENLPDYIKEMSINKVKLETNDAEQIPSTSRDFKRFFGGSKKKKGKKS